MSHHELDNVRVEVAFSPDPNTTNATFRDLTSRARLDRGIEITRGRSEASGQVQTGSCSLTFDNTDGALTPENAASPYFPNVKPQNRLRITYRDTEVPGNLLTAENAAFEGGTIGTWVASSGVTLANSTTQKWQGTRALQVAWTGSLKTTYIPQSGLVAGRTYTWSAYVYVGGVSGSSVGIGVAGIGTSGTRTSWNNTWGRLSYTFTATGSTHFLELSIIGSTTRTDYIDAAMLDEGSTLAAFTTTPAPIRYRFDGYVDEWPVEWPRGGQTESVSQVRAFDMQSRLARSRQLGSVIEETLRLDSPGWYFPLSEPQESTSAGDRIGASSIAVTQVNDGGEIEFASGTGPATDASSSPTFRPVDRYNGQYLLGRVDRVEPLGLSRTLTAIALTSVVGVQTIAEWVDVWGVGLKISTNSVGKAVARWVNPWNESQERAVTSAQTYADGKTHTYAATLSDNGSGTSTLRLYVDGVERGTTATFPTSSSGYIIPGFERLSVGGTAYGDMFDGVISHVAGFGSLLNTTQLAEIHTAATTGFAGERTDERITRIAEWIGLDGFVSLETGLSTVGHVDPTGKTAWAYMQDVADTESGLLFADNQGAIRFLNRANTFDVAAPVDVSVTAEEIGPNARMAAGVADVANEISVSREGGATVQVSDAQSQAEYGLVATSIRTLAATDEQALDRAYWELNNRAHPLVKLPTITLDAYAEPDNAADVRALGIWGRVQVTDLPSQAPRSTEDLRVEGYSERIGADGWVVTANTSPFIPLPPLIADDPVYGESDAGNVAVY